MNLRRTLTLTLVLPVALVQVSGAAPSGGCNASGVEIVNPVPNGRFYGSAVAMSADVLVVGSSISPAGSAVAVHERDFGGPGNWGLAKTLIPTSPATGSFGAAVAVSGDTIVVGSPGEALGTSFKGAAYVFDRDQGGAGNWGLTRKVLAPTDPQDDFGIAVAIDGDRIAVGAPSPGPGRVVVFGRDVGGPDNWGVEDLVPAPSVHSVRFGEPLSLAGTTLAVGDIADNGFGSFSGAVTLFEPSAGAWTETARVVPPNGLPGQAFGGSVAIEGDVLVAGAYLADPGGVNGAGAAWVFGRDVGGANGWGSVAMLTASTPSVFGRLGLSAAISGELIAVGAPTHSSGPCTNVGRAYLYARDLGGLDAWGEVTPLVSPSECGDRFSEGLALAGTTLVVGAPNADSVVGNSGSVFLYENAIAGQSVPYCSAGTTSGGCQTTMSGLGTPSASAPSGFDLVAANVDGARQGLFFFGTSGRQASPWGGGSSFRCVVPPIQRTAVQSSRGTPGACDGDLTLDFNAWMTANPGLAPSAGTRVYAQAWFRDPPAPKTTSLSNALDFTVCP